MGTAFEVGFGIADITPSQSVRVAGYFYPRQSTGVHDQLCARAMAVSDGESRGVICCVDLRDVSFDVTAEARRLAKAQLGLDEDEMIISAIHTHTGPDMSVEAEYAASVPAKIVMAIKAALDDMKPRKLKAGSGTEDTVQHIRRYRMKDGCVVTNPGAMNRDIVAPIGEPDREVLALLVSDDAGAVGGAVNFGLHCDTVGGTELSADWTHYARKTMIREFGREINVLTPIGSAGDVNHINVFKPGPIRGFDLAEEIGSKIATAAIAALDDGNAVESGPVVTLSRTIEAPIRVPTPAELKEAQLVWAQPPPTDKDFTMDRVEARRRIQAAKLGPNYPLDVTVLAIGGIAFVGMPVEYFSSLGREIKHNSPFEHTFLCTLANGFISYAPAKQNYAEGGYETTVALVAPGTGELIAGVAAELLHEARKRR